MAYAKFSLDSDVYVYGGQDGPDGQHNIICSGCLLEPADEETPGFTFRESRVFYAKQEILDHLKDHREAGHAVPDGTFTDTGRTHGSGESIRLIRHSREDHFQDSIQVLRAQVQLPVTVIRTAPDRLLPGDLRPPGRLAAFKRLPDGSLAFPAGITGDTCEPDDGHIISPLFLFAAIAGQSPSSPSSILHPLSSRQNRTGTCFSCRSAGTGDGGGASFAAVTRVGELAVPSAGNTVTPISVADRTFLRARDVSDHLSHPPGDRRWPAEVFPRSRHLPRCEDKSTSLSPCTVCAVPWPPLAQCGGSSQPPGSYCRCCSCSLTSAGRSLHHAW